MDRQPPKKRENPLKKGQPGKAAPQRKTRKKSLIRQLQKNPRLLALGAAALALLVLVIVLLAKGCSGDSGTTSKKVCGTVVLTYGAHVEIDYDQNGKILRLRGMNDLGQTAVAAESGLVGKDVTKGVDACLSALAEDSVIRRNRSLAIRVKFGDRLPKDDFLETVAEDARVTCREKGINLKVYPIGPDKLEPDGTINMETCKTMAMDYLGALMMADIGGDETPVDNVYTFSFENRICTVDTNTGLVTDVE